MSKDDDEFCAAMANRLQALRLTLGFETAADLFRSWKKYAAEAGEEIGSQKRFANTMQARGYSRWRIGRARGFKGIRVLRQNYTEDPRYGA